MTPRQTGFTLIEVLAAFTIAATALALLFRIHSNSTATTLLAEEYVIAVELARSLIDELSVTETTLEFTHDGQLADKYTWTANARAYRAEARPNTSATNTSSDSSRSGGEQPPFVLRDITVSVTWRSRAREEHFELHTVRPFSTLDDETVAGQTLIAETRNVRWLP